MPTRWFLLVALVAAVAAGAVVARHPRPADGPAAPGSASAVALPGGYRFEDVTGRPAPEFSLTDLHGARHTLREYRGRVVMLVFWATWCKTCPEELPHLSDIARALASKGLVTLSINGETDLGPVAKMTHGLAFPVLRDPEERVRHAYDAFAVPRVVLVDRAGRIARVIRGYQGESTPIVNALAEQGLKVREGVMGTRPVPVERVPGG